MLTEAFLEYKNWEINENFEMKMKYVVMKV